MSIESSPFNEWLMVGIVIIGIVVWGIMTLRDMGED